MNDLAAVYLALGIALAGLWIGEGLAQIDVDVIVKGVATEVIKDE